jgi:enoyl-CoA hydratase/carnithine racemase
VSDLLLERDEAVAIVRFNRPDRLRPAAALRMGKAILDRSLGCDYRAVVELEAQAQGILGTTEAHHEAVKAFVRRERKD